MLYFIERSKDKDSKDKVECNRNPFFAELVNTFNWNPNYSNQIRVLNEKALT